MSWTLFKTKCNVLTGPQHITTELFANTIASAYHQAVTLHFDSMTAGGKLVNNAPKFPVLYNQILAQCQANLSGHDGIEFTQQIGPFIQAYWTGLVIIGPTGTVTITSPGQWAGIPTPANQNFQIILNNIVTSARTHIMTLTGIYVSSVLPGVTSPWSGAMLQSLP